MGPDVSPGPVTRAARARELVGVVLTAVIFALFARTFLVQAFVVPSSSMETAVLIGDHLLVNKFVFAPHGRLLANLLPYQEVRRGDIIVFKFPGNPATDFIKRVAALPGDTVEVRGEAVFVNGTESRPGPKGSSPATEATGEPRVGPIRVLPDEYFAMGDNRRESYDSRSWGPVPADHLKGRAFLVYWSSDGARPPAGGPLRDALDRVARTRWSRTFRLVR